MTAEDFATADDAVVLKHRHSMTKKFCKSLHRLKTMKLKRSRMISKFDFAINTRQMNLSKAWEITKILKSINIKKKKKKNNKQAG